MRPGWTASPLDPEYSRLKIGARLRTIKHESLVGTELACSPRPSVALSAFSVLTWLREIWSLTYRRMDARNNAVRPKVAAARKMISRLTPRNEDQRRKIPAAENLLDGVENFFLPRLEGITPM